MTLLVTPDELRQRRRIAAGPLAPLAASIAADLEPLHAAELLFPVEKARLSRAGGRCPRDGAALDFDPWTPRAHRCPACGTVYDDEAHYRYWLMWYQLWLAERAVHGAVLFALGAEERHAVLARRILAGYAERYAGYANRDNVLGPARVFFSTYLESIWLLQLCVALDLLEGTGSIDARLADDVRERIVAPASAIIRAYDEGTSNRQAWNVAALLAAARVLGDERAAAAAVRGPSGLTMLLSHALLADGSWFEGENYHVFAHRGLWYGVTMAARAGLELPHELVSRFDAGFALPFRTALPDMTMLARRDSQHAISLRQWRFAELCELGLARGDDAELRAALARLYADDIPRGHTGRSRSSADAERHSPASALARTDLGWRSLLHALPELPSLERATPTSVLLQNQGLAAIRRDAGDVVIALDYGTSGGGHGHPDRLGLVVAQGTARWLDDPGTGSYVDRSLHWYRSSLAHNAPLIDRSSQRRVAGRALGYDDRGGAGWAAARVDGIAPGVRVERRVVVMPDYLVDELTWQCDALHLVGLPLHLEGEVDGATWSAALLDGAGGLEDGFDFVHDAERARDPAWPAVLRAVRGDARSDVWIVAPNGTALWRGRAPGPPGQGERRFHFLECGRPKGSFTTVLSWRGAVARVEARDGSIVVHLEDGAIHEHASAGGGWHIELRAGGARSSLDFAPDAPASAAGRPSFASETSADDATSAGDESSSQSQSTEPPFVRLERDRSGRSGDVVVPLGELAYRRSEQTWREAGAPTAEVTLRADRAGLHVAVESRTGPPVVLPDGAENDMDNEHADVNASGVQLHLLDGRGAFVGWLARPSPSAAGESAASNGRTAVRQPARTRALAPGVPEIVAHWATTATGWIIDATIPYAVLGDASPYSVGLGVVVNEIPHGRERRRGQLVLGGAHGEWVFLRGDRHDPARLLHVLID